MRMKKADAPIKLHGWCPKCKSVKVDTYGGKTGWQKSIADWGDKIPTLPHYGCTQFPDGEGRTKEEEVVVIRAEDDF